MQFPNTDIHVYLNFPRELKKRQFVQTGNGI